MAFNQVFPVVESGGGGGSGYDPVIESGSASGVSSLTFSDMSDANAIRIIVQGVKASSDNLATALVGSIDGGSTFETGASDYRWHYMLLRGSASSLGFSRDTADDSFCAFYFQGADTEEVAHYEFEIWNINDTANQTMIKFETHHIETNGQPNYILGQGTYVGADNMDAFKLNFSKSVDVANYAVHKIL